MVTAFGYYWHVWNTLYDLIKACALREIHCSFTVKIIAKRKKKKTKNKNCIGCLLILSLTSKSVFVWMTPSSILSSEVCSRMLVIIPITLPSHCYEWGCDLTDRFQLYESLPSYLHTYGRLCGIVSFIWNLCVCVCACMRAMESVWNKNNEILSMIVCICVCLCSCTWVFGMAGRFWHSQGFSVDMMAVHASV